MFDCDKFSSMLVILVVYNFSDAYSVKQKDLSHDVVRAFLLSYEQLPL